jgi:alkanesulfonate monooxygenase SsuD/methylene tetrahydromethanopterin reductase-like flavin-dependent oxidoreductase (luciferase family)
MGTTRLTGGESVEALEEGIDIIREVWRADERTPLRYPGKHYTLDGAKRGPAPAHDIPIWIGALKPRMQRLIGRTADGWLPSLGRLGDDGLREGNTIIDEAAVEAGRDPREIRRLLNIGGAMSAEDLTALAIGEGVSTFILATDDPGMLQQFAENVAPAVREAVDRERRL